MDSLRLVKTICFFTLNKIEVNAFSKFNNKKEPVIKKKHKSNIENTYNKFKKGNWLQQERKDQSKS